ncbi:MAG TPA: hypothetical protein VLL08_26710 [Kineosporiaceae bacterium]|nr:hypothetical protein [Kineosporiaceae bacterium]
MPKPQLPAAARAISAATTDAVSAARAQDVNAFDEATGRLAAAEPEQVRVVLGVVVRALLEDLHPDGVSSDDLLELIKSCVRTAFGWYPAVDVQVLIVVLTGALGVHEPDEEPRRVTALEVARHAPLFIAELLVAPGSAAHTADPRPLADYFTDAFLEISRAEVNEMP